MRWLLVDVHLGVAIILAIGSLGMTIMAFRSKRQGALATGFWKGLTHVERLIVVQALIGIILYITGARSLDPLHYLYGGLLLLAVAVEQGLRPGRGFRENITRDYGRFNEPVVFGWVMLVMFLLIGRAITTGVWGV